MNLSDAVFAIAMTLLVLTLEAPRVAPDELAGALAEKLPQLVVFALAFLLVAQAWWQHHKIFAALAWVDSGMIWINLVALAGVALMPFPTSLVGSAPTSRAAVLSFIGLFIVLTLLYLTLILRAQRHGAWRRPLSERLFHWVLADWLANAAMMGVSLLVALWVPLAGLAVLTLSTSIIGATVGRLSPRERRAWF